MRAIGIVVLMAALVALGWALNDAMLAPSQTEVTPIVLDTKGERPEREKTGAGKGNDKKGPGNSTGGATSGGGSGAQPVLPPPAPAGGNDDDDADDDDAGGDGSGSGGT